jgi:hypothetical protein
MKTYIAKWPDGSVSILNAIDKDHLYIKLDAEGDPYCCELYEIKSESEDFHFSFEIAKQGEEMFVDIEPVETAATLKKTKLPKDSFEKHLSLLTGKSLKQIKANPNIPEIKKQMGIDQ